MTSPYRVRLFVPQDRHSLEGLYCAVYGEVWRERTNLRWTLDHPLDEAGAAVAVEGDRVVSAQPYCDLPLHTPWGRSRATLFLDVATHPAHQRRGLFRRGVAAASEAAFARGSTIIATTPNPMAFQGFMTMSQWVHLCTLDCLLLPLGAGEQVMGGNLTSCGARVAFAAASVLRKNWRTRAALPPPSRYVVKMPWSPGDDADELWACAAVRPEEPHAAELLNPSHWYMSLADSDLA